MESDLCYFYTRIITSIGLKIDEHGLIHSVSSTQEKIPERIRKKKLYIPFSYALEQFSDEDDYLGFHPLGEKNKGEISEIHLWLSRKMTCYLNHYLYQLVHQFLSVVTRKKSIDKDDNVENEPILLMIKDISKYLRYVFEDQTTLINYPNIESIERIGKTIKIFNNDPKYQLLSIVTLPPANSSQKKDKSITIIQFSYFNKIYDNSDPIFNFLMPNDKLLIETTLEFILENHSSGFSQVSNSKIAPHFHSLLLSYFQISLEINKKVRCIDKQPNIKRGSITLIDTGYISYIQNLSQYKDSIDILLQCLSQHKKHNEHPPISASEKLNKPFVTKPVKQAFLNLSPLKPLKFDENIITWLKTHHRACYWFWMKLLVHPQPSIPNNEHPASNARRYTIIKDYYTHIPSHPSGIEPIKLKQEWDNYFLIIKKKTSFLENLNPIDRIWAINYFDKYLKKEYSDNLACFNAMIISIENEPKLSLNIFIDGWIASVDKKIQFLKKMKNAWSRRNCSDRIKTSKKKNNHLNEKSKFNLVLDKQTYDDLFLLADCHDRTVEQEIKKLIEEGMINEK